MEQVITGKCQYSILEMLQNIVSKTVRGTSSDKMFSKSYWLHYVIVALYHAFDARVLYIISK